MRDSVTDVYRHYRGTADELLARGVLEPYMLERLGPERRRASGSDEFGDHWECHRLRDGRLHLLRRARAHDRRSADTVAESTHAFVATILERVAKQRRS